MKYIHLSRAHYKEMLSLLNDNKKIAAIKLVRNEGRMKEADRTSNNTSGIGLREAKHAVESINGNMPETSCVLIPTLKIKRIIIEGDAGDIELDLDGLQLRLLDGLAELPLHHMESSMELMKFIRDWDNFGGSVE